jgi:hypothetical protein
MTVQVEVDPMIGATSFGTAEKLTVEAPRGRKIVDRKGQVKWRNAHAVARCFRAPLLSTLSSQPNCR